MNKLYNKFIANSPHKDVNLNDIDSVSFFTIIIVSILIITLILSIILNVFTISSIVLMKNFKQINILILNLALADLVHVMGIPLFIVQTLVGDLDVGVIGCRLFFLSDFIGMIVSAFTVASLSTERYFKVADNKKRIDRLSNKLKILITLLYLMFVWLLAILFPLPFILSLEQDLEDGVVCYTRWEINSINAFFGLKFGLIFLFPCALISLSSIKLLFFLKTWRNKMNESADVSYLNPIKMRTLNMAKTMSHNIDEINNMNDNETNVTAAAYSIALSPKQFKSHHNKVQRKASFTVLMIVLLFFIQWMPLWIIQLVIALKYELTYLKDIVLITTLLTYTNSISNPVLYIIMTSDFKTFLKKYLASESYSID